MNKGDSLPTVEKVITQAQIEKYARASGDFNPIHLDHGSSRRQRSSAGLSRTA